MIAGLLPSGGGVSKEEHMSESSVTVIPGKRREMVEGTTLLIFPSSPPSLPVELLYDLPEGCLWEVKVVRVSEANGG